MTAALIRPVNADDFAGWRPLWDGYNAFYGRHGEQALPEAITLATWERLLDPAEPMHALVAQQAAQLVGLTHFIFHRSTTRLEPSCYLSDLYTLPGQRGQGVGRALVEAVADHARARGVQRVYWQTHESNHGARRLYEQLAQHQGFIVYAMTL